jgi:multidrug efflux pump subunit AcrA (membrane-fusion protein)
VSTSEYSQSSSERGTSVDAEQVERAKREIQGLIQEISELSRSDASPADFYDAMLNKVVTALAAPGGAVWTIAETGGLQLAYQINLRITGLAENEVGQRQHGRLLHQVLNGSEGALVAPHSGAGDATDSDEEAAANPTEFLLVLAPVHNDQGPQGVVEVFQRPGARITTQRGYLRFLLQVCEFAGDFLKGRRLRHLSEKQSLWEQLESFTRTAHEKLDVRHTAYTIANEGRRLIGCDRVSVAIRRGGKCPVEAVSGQDVFDKRSNVMVMLSKLANAVVKTGEAVWYAGDTSDMAPQVEEALDAYVDESHTKAIAILPLVEPRDAEAKFTEEGEVDPARVIGALIVEQMVDSRTPDGFLQRVDVVRSHSATALANALEYEGLFLMPVWRALGKSTRLFRGRTLPKTLAVIAAIVAATAFLCLYPANFKLKGDGELKPTVRQHVWAEVDGYVQDVKATHDQAVKKGDVLVVQESPDLDKEIESLRGQLLEAEADLKATRAQLDYNDELTETEKNERESHATQLIARIASLQKQLDLQKMKKEKLRARSPMDGRVITWNVENRLRNRPVNRGDELLEVADFSSPWELEVSMPESRMGHIAKAQQAAAAAGQKLPVKFILALNPGEEIEGVVEEVHRSAEVRGESGNTVLVRVSFDQNRLREVIKDPNVGNTATAKIYCGKRAIGYVWLHDLVDFVRATILFRIF